MTHLVQLMPDHQALLRWAADHKFVIGDDISYGLHAILSAAFGDHAPRSFVFLDSYRGHRQAHLLAYSAYSAAELRDNAALFGEPLALQALRVEQASSKEMPRIKAGTRLGMDIVTRPVVREDRDRGGVAKATEHDPYMLAKAKAGGQPLELTRDQIYLDWLEGRLAERGLDVEAMSVVGRRQIALARRDRSDGTNATRLREVSGQEVRYQGIVRVADDLAFNEGLPKGIGRHRGFGYGMMVLRPPSEIVGARAA